MAAVVRSRFYPLIAFALAALVVGGFARTYYLRVLFDAPPLTFAVHLHALVFSAWLALFVVQVRLVARHQQRLHRRLGVAGVLLAVAVIVVGIFTALMSVEHPRPRPMGFTELQFLVMPLTSILLFAASVGAALALRRQPELHKRFMLLGMISILGPAVGRLLGVLGLREHFLFAQTAVAALFVTWALVHDWRQREMLHPVIAVGGPLLVMSWPVRAAIGGSDSWLQAARWLTSWES
jgi:hypothetical protein